MIYKEDTLKTEFIYNGRILNLRVDTVHSANGVESHREIIEHAKSVVVIPFKDENTIYMIRQYRKAVDSILIEFPAGLVDSGENSENAAIRELQEEIGFSARELLYLGQVYTSPGFTDEKVDIFVARDLYESKLEADEDESIEVIEVKIDELEDLVRSFNIKNASTLIAALYTLRKREING